MSKELVHNSNENHRARLKDRFEKTGIESLQPHEILEMLLFYVIKRKDTKPVARQLLREFGSLSRVFDASIEDLVKVNGVGKETALLIKFVSQTFRAYRSDIIGRNNKISARDADESIEFAKSLFYGKTNEEFYVILLDARLKIINHVFISEGVSSEVNAHPKKILEAIVRNNAESVIFAHNHPNGIAAPSREDMELTSEFSSLFTSVGIRLADHIIVAGNETLSLASIPKFRALFI